MGFSAEQLAKWVAERTDVHVGNFCYFFLGDLFVKCLFYLISPKVTALKIRITFYTI